MRNYLAIISVMFLVGCGSDENTITEQLKNTDRYSLQLEDAKSLMVLPLNCIDTEYPNKLGQVIGSEIDLGTPSRLHPSFYGCFDWHSAVHGHWSLVRICNTFTDLKERNEIIQKLAGHITTENIDVEIEYFKKELNGTYERMYGWAWLLKLSEELRLLKHSLAEELVQNLNPLTELIVEKVKEFLPKLHYPIRVGTHTNTAFAMTMIYDYGFSVGDTSLVNAVSKRAKEFYLEDVNCPMNWEPSGYDFLSPCLEEADIMRRVLSKEEFKQWLESFLPELSNTNYKLEPGIVADRKDGHLVHLDGLNFSRAWCLYGIAETLPEYKHLIKIANEHVDYSLPNLTDDSYEGGHWLASFALLSLGV